MTHGDAVVHCDGIEFFGQAARFFDFAGNHLAQVVQMHMAGHELGERVGDGDNRLAEIFVGHAGGAPQCAGAGHIAAVGGGFGAVGWHVWGSLIEILSISKSHFSNGCY